MMKRSILLLLIGLFWMNLAFTQPIVIVMGNEDTQVVKKQIAQHLDELDIKENVQLIVNFIRNVPGHVEGLTFCLNSPASNIYQVIKVWIDARLNKMQQKLVLAHEMVHVKQFVKGELKVVSHQRLMWKGKYYYQRAYSEQTPWEREAFAIDHLLAKQHYPEEVITPSDVDRNP